MTRAEMSGAPPGGIGTISLIGRDGYCAHEASENRAANASTVKRLMPSSCGVCRACSMVYEAFRPAML